MNDLYDGKLQEDMDKKESLVEDIPTKWKEAITQIDYGIDVSTSSILLFGDIMDGTLFDIMTKVKGLIHMRSDSDKNNPINLIINSDGGSVYEALGIIDFMEGIDVKINTVCRGRAMSAAALILCSGTGIRAASQNSTIMFHEMSSGIYGKSSDMKANVQHMEQLEHILVDIMVRNSKKSSEFWVSNTIKDFYITPTDAIDLGVIDKIILPKHKRG
jgi:ATP-dependent Clp protease protease subunit